jgi:hypothetical protein
MPIILQFGAVMHHITPTKAIPTLHMVAWQCQIQLLFVDNDRPALLPVCELELDGITK